MRLKDYNYSWAGAYFITICCHEKRHLFGRISDGQVHLNNYGCIVREEWLMTHRIRERLVLDTFIVMPNHFHAIMIIKHEPAKLNNPMGEPPFAKQNPGEPPFAPTVGDVMKGFKQAVTMRMRSIGYTGKVWQKGYYDHIIRNIHDYDATVAYIKNNPSRWTVGANGGSPTKNQTQPVSSGGSPENLQGGDITGVYYEADHD
jgi:REP element-mobilizing transposase RayT